MDCSFFLSPFQHFIRIQPIGFDALSQIRRIRLFDLIPLVFMPLVILPLEFFRRCSIVFIIFFILCYGIWRIQDLQFPVMDIDPYSYFFTEFLLRYRFVTPGSFVPPCNRNDQIQIRKLWTESNSAFILTQGPSGKGLTHSSQSSWIWLWRTS